MYQALYRKYRPKTFDELLGQEHIVRVLKNQVKNGSIGHAYLFSGTRGTGKTSAAKIFSRAVNCLEAVDGNPCNQCENCLEILEERSMDVIEMDAASYNSVDDVRDLRDKVKYLPAKIKYKVYIMDEVHMLSGSAFNALLKTLEEPPKHLIFILATTEPEKLPSTVLSRCQRFDFRRITNKDIVLNMKGILKDLDLEAEDKALFTIARNSDGAMRDALSLLDKCVAFSDKKISYEDTLEILGMANKEVIFQLIDRIKEKNIEEVLKGIDEILQAGKSVGQFFKDLINHFRDLMLVKSSKQTRNLEDIGELDAYIEQGQDMDIFYILRAIDILTMADANLKKSTEQRIILEMALLKLTNMDEILDLEKRIKALEEGQGPIKREEKKPVIKKERPKVEVVPTLEPVEIIDHGEELSLAQIDEEWPEILEKVKSKDVKSHAFLVEGQVLSYSDGLLKIGYRDGMGFHQQAISSEPRKELVENIVSASLNKKLRINFIMSNESRHGKDQEEAEKEVIDKDKAIQEVVDLFGEDIVEIIE